LAESASFTTSVSVKVVEARVVFGIGISSCHTLSTTPVRTNAQRLHVVRRRPRHQPEAHRGYKVVETELRFGWWVAPLVGCIGGDGWCELVLGPNDVECWEGDNERLTVEAVVSDDALGVIRNTYICCG
jgi:hypothetical protein